MKEKESIYQEPRIEVVEVMLEGAVLSDSNPSGTGEGLTPGNGIW
ncbi:MAG: hypothetical protein ACI3ZL_05445 [Candidatus Cryptobacteroides sp.]